MTRRHPHRDASAGRSVPAHVRRAVEDCPDR
jgi:hypothetical protein